MPPGNTQPRAQGSFNSRYVTINNVWQTEISALAVTEPLLQALFEWDHLDFVPRSVEHRFTTLKIQHTGFCTLPSPPLIFIPTIIVNTWLYLDTGKHLCLSRGKKYILWKAKHKLSDISKASRHRHHVYFLLFQELSFIQRTRWDSAAARPRQAKATLKGLIGTALCALPVGKVNDRISIIFFQQHPPLKQLLW